MEVVTVPEVLALPGQMKPLAGDAKATLESPDEKVRVTRANTEARVAPTREGYVNAIQVWPFTDGALYQVYAAVGRVTVIALQPGEELVTVAAGDTVRWIVGDIERQRRCAARQCDGQAHPLGPQDQFGHHDQSAHLPARTDFDREDMDGFGVLGIPQGQDAGPQRQAQAASAAAPVDAGLSLEKIRFATRSAAAIRRGSRCGPLTMARRSISSFRRASLKASYRQCS